MARDNVVRAGDLGLHPNGEAPARLEDMSLEEVESFLVKKALARYGGNISQAAEALGLSRGALYRRLQKFGESQ
jgi:DNA-binding protein Fis